jgi:hypothetical protein
VRIDRGWDRSASRAFDLAIIPAPGNYMGSFIVTSHSGPYGYLQDVPLLLYGPGFVKPLGHTKLDREVTIADLAPTYARLMGFGGWPKRHSRPLTEVLEDTTDTPRLIVTTVVDGGGWNALERWPDSWPNIARLMEDGATVDDAIVGSSPSITPATHTNISVGDFPKRHGVTAIAVRGPTGRIVGSFSEKAGAVGGRNMDPRVSLKLPTIGDLWDRSVNNEAKIGFLASGSLALGLLGFGAALPGGDRDIAALQSSEGWSTTPSFYSLPDYVADIEGPRAEIEAVDRLDGQLDGRWLGHAIEPVDATPALAPWTNRVTTEILGREGFGRDEITDLWYMNLKAPDKAGHKWNMIAEEQRDVLASVDQSVADLLEWLDRNVGEGNYVFVLTADHGQTPLDQGGWPINRSEIRADIDRRFDKVDNGKGLVERTSASSFFMRRSEIQESGTTPEEIASFLSRYTIGDNIPEGEEVPEGFEDRLEERVMSGVVPGRKIADILACTDRD